MNLRRDTENQSGYLLVGVAVTMTTLAVLGLALSFYNSLAVEKAARYENQTKALYIAEAGLATFLDQYWIRGNPEDATSPLEDTLANGSYTAEILSSNGGVYVVQAEGKFRDMAKSIEVRVSRDNASVWPYVLFTHYDKVMLKYGDGNVTGDIHSNRDVMIDYDDYRITGTVTEAPPVVDPPEVDFTALKNLAKAAHHYYCGSRTFSRECGPYTGIWYVSGNARIRERVVFRGCIVAGGKVILEGGRISMTAVPATLPVIVAGDNVEGLGDDIQISGFIYAKKDFILYGADLRVEGALVALRKIFPLGNDLSIIHRPNFLSNLTGVRFEVGESSGLEVTEWREW